MSGQVFAAPKSIDPIDLTLYTTKVPATSQQVEEREQLFRQAFQDVIVRLTGSPSFLESPAFKNALTKIDPFVSRFSYEGFGGGSETAKNAKGDF